MREFSQPKCSILAGEDFLLDSAGLNADELFEDIGHSNGAREDLKSYFVGNLKIDAEEIKKRKEKAGLLNKNRAVWYLPPL